MSLLADGLKTEVEARTRPRCRFCVLLENLDDEDRETVNTSLGAIGVYPTITVLRAHGMSISEGTVKRHLREGHAA